MRLIDVYQYGGSYELLYQLLKEREPHECISHREMPEWDAHCYFVKSRPYMDWRIIGHDGRPRGAVYLTRQGELGVGVLKAHRRHGFARQALQEMMRLHPGRFLANINPANEASIALFRSLGFGGPIQITMEKRP